MNELTPRALLLKVLPEGCTVHVIERTKGEDYMEVDVYRIVSYDHKQSETHHLNTTIADMLNVPTTEQLILLEGKNVDLRSEFVQWLSTKLYGYNNALYCEKL